MNLYEISKQVVMQEEPMDSIAFVRAVNDVAQKMAESHAWMLLCRERNDYTVFVNTYNSSKKKISKELIPTLTNRGLVVHIDEQQPGVWEIWIKDKAEKDSFAYYLFDYSGALIDCGGGQKDAN